MPCSPRPLLLRRAPSLLSLDPASRRNIYDFLPPSDLHMLSQVSFALDYDIAAYWSHIVKAMCSRFVSFPSELLLAMRDNRSVFSGSAVLAVVTRATWKPGDLDIYCPLGAFLGLVYHFALIQGFQLQNPEVLGWDEDNHELGTDLVGAHGYIDARQILRVAHMKKGDIDIDIVQSTSDTALSPLAAFWTTAVQNFITPTTICIAYPVLTEAGCSLLAPRHLVDLQLPPPRIVDLIRKYEGRNFRFAVRPYALGGDISCAGIASAACAAAVRFFGDEHCLTLEMRPVIKRMSLGPSSTLLDTDNVFWWQGGYTCGLECAAIGMRVWPGMLIATEGDDEEVE